MAEPSIVHDQGEWLVVDKPAGWHTVRGATPAATDGSGVVETWLVQRRPDLAALPESGLVHRLDRGTSGCVVVATNAKAHADLSRRFRESVGVRKVYLARAHPGLADEGAATLFFFSRHKRSAKVTVEQHGDPKHAGRFHWRIVARDAVAGDLVELELQGPGKRHQLRAGCAHLGHPFVGDVLYSGREAAAVCLHAWTVEIDGVIVRSPPPEWAGLPQRC